MLQTMHVVMVGPCLLSSQNGLDHACHYARDVDVLFSCQDGLEPWIRIRPCKSLCLGHGSLLAKKVQKSKTKAQKKHKHRQKTSRFGHERQKHKGTQNQHNHSKNT